MMVRDANALLPRAGRAARTTSTRSTRGAAHNRYLDTIAITEGPVRRVDHGQHRSSSASPTRSVRCRSAAEAIEQAIELNGAAVEANQLAFRWGRMWAVDPDRVPRGVGDCRRITCRSRRRRSRTRDHRGRARRRRARAARPQLRAADLADYQNDAYAESLPRDGAVSGRPAGQAAFAEAVARDLYKLMAYKDEYEVARLHLEARRELPIVDTPSART